LYGYRSDLTVSGLVKEGAERKSVALKLWVGGITAAKGTRKTYSVEAGGEKEYSPEEMGPDFKAADNYANKDELFRTGVEVAPILELIIRKTKEFSLDIFTVKNAKRREGTKCCVGLEKVVGLVSKHSAI
jgi:hypothetical protein